CEDAVAIDQLMDDPNPARWQKRFDPLHAAAIGCAMIDKKPVPAFLLYKPPGWTRYGRLGGMHRKQACIDIPLPTWPAYVIDAEISDFLLEALPIWDNFGVGLGYSKEQKLAFAAYLFRWTDQKPAVIAKKCECSVQEINHYIEYQAVLERAHKLD